MGNFSEFLLSKVTITGNSVQWKLMPKVTLNTITSGYQSKDLLNTNFDTIETAFDNTLSRDGSSPNSMSAEIDMNSNHITNLATPTNNTHAATKKYVDDLLSGTTDTGAAQLRIDLASDATGDGASLVGVEDSAANFTATNVEAVLAEVQGNIDQVYTDLDVITTRGDMVVGGATGATARLARGTEGQGLAINSSGDVIWTGRPNPNSVINGDFGCWSFGTSVATSAGTLTWVCDQFYALSAGAAVTVARASNNVAGSFSRYRAQITGATSVTTVKFATRLLAQDVAELVAYSAGYITISFKFTNNTGGSFQPVLKLYTPAAENDWTTPTERDSTTLSSVADGNQANYSYSLDAAALTNIENGLEISIEIPSGNLDSAAKNISIAELKAERGQVVTDFISLGGSYTANTEACLGFYESCSPVFGFVATAASQAASITIPFNKRKWTSSVAVSNSLSIANGTLTALTVNEFGWFMTLTSSGAGQVQISSGSIIADARLT